MRKLTVPQAAAIVVLAVPIAIIARTTHSYNKQLYARFPEFDHKVIRKAYKKLMSDAMRGKIDVDDWSDERFDQHFRFECFELMFVD